MAATSPLGAQAPLQGATGVRAAIVLSTGLLLAAFGWIVLATPADITLGIVQKIFYIHVGSAFAMLLLLVAGSVASLADLLGPQQRLDAAARASIEVGLLFGLVVLSSGPLWARKSWGAWWTWEPRLTLTLLVVLIAVAVLLIRERASDVATGRRIGAAMAVLAAPTAWLIHIAVKMWGGTHPQVIQGGGIQSDAMQIAFRLAVAGLLSFAATLWWLRYRGLRLEQRLGDLRLARAALDLGAPAPTAQPTAAPSHATGGL